MNSTKNKNPKTDPKKLPQYDQMIDEVETTISEIEIQDLAADQTPDIKEKTTLIIQQLAVVTQIEPSTIFTGFALILQSGGYLKGVNNRRVRIGEHEFTKTQFVSAMRNMKCNYTLRTIARINRDIIAKIARKYEAPGNLYSQYKIVNPGILKQPKETQIEHAIYCTDFQRENPNIPSEVLEFLSKREIKRKDN